MQRILRFSYHFPKTALLFLIVVTLFAGVQLKDLNISIAATGLASEHDPAVQAYAQIKKTFGNDVITLIVIHDEALFTPEKIKQLALLNASLEKLKGIRETRSLFNISNLQNVNDEIVTNPFFSPIPASTEAARRIQEQAINNPLVRDNFISRDGKTIAINLVMEESREDNDFDKQITENIEALLKPLRSHYKAIYQVGPSYVRNAITERIREDQQQMLPVAMLIISVILAIGMRSLSGALIPALTSVISIIWTLGMMAYLDISIGVMTSIIPALLVIIGSTEDVHLLSEYKMGINNGLKKLDALAYMSNNMGRTILLTFITTYLGFLSIATSDISLLSEFGLIASTGILFNLIATTMIIPVVLLYFSKNSKSREKHSNDGVCRHITTSLFNIIFKNRLIFIGLVLICTLWALQASLSLRVNNNAIENFGSHSELAKNVNKLHQQLSGMQTLSIVLDSGIEGTFKKVKYLNELLKIQNYVNSVGHFDKSVSLADFMALLNNVMQDDGDAYFLPEDDELLREYLFFLKFDLIKNYISADFKTANILVRHNLNDSSELNKAVSQLQEYLNHNVDHALDVTITGSSVISSHASDLMASGQAKSLVLMSLAILIIVAILFVNLKAGMLAIIPNLFPIIILFGVMGEFNIPLDTGTAMVAVIALGICVDDTIHFMSRYHQNTQHREDVSAALLETVKEESTPIITTSLALAAGFLTMASSGFAPIVNFGVLSAMVMLVAMISTFIITPLLLSYVRLSTMWEMLSLNLKNQVTQQCELFQGMGAWAIKQTILTSEVRNYKENEKVVIQGESGHEMFVVLEGALMAQKVQEDGSLVHMTQMVAGSVFGEIALVANMPRTADVVTRNSAKVLVIDWDSIKSLSRFHPRIATRLFLNLSSIVGKRLVNQDSKTVIRDELTGAFNRHFLEEQIKFEVERARRYKEPLSIVSISMDYIADNEEFTNLLRDLTSSISQQMRKVDVFARWGGRSFMILLPRTDVKDARVLADRITLTFTDNKHQNLKPTQFSVHVNALDDNWDVNDLIKHADNLLLVEKQVD